MDEKFKPVFSKQRLTTPTGLVIWPKVFAPDNKTPQNPFGDGKYKITLGFEKQAEKLHEDPGMKAMLVEGMKVAKETWGNGIKFGELTFAITDGDAYYEKAPDEKKPKLEYYRGKWWITPKNKKPIGVRSADNKTPLTESSELYGGCFARASLTVYSYQNTEKVKVIQDGVAKEERQTVRGITFQLRAVQKAKDGPAIGGTINAEEEFDALEIEDEMSFEDDMDDNFGGAVEAGQRELTESGFDESDIPF